MCPLLQEYQTSFSLSCEYKKIWLRSWVSSACSLAGACMDVDVPAKSLLSLVMAVRGAGTRGSVDGHRPVSHSAILAP